MTRTIAPCAIVAFALVLASLLCARATAAIVLVPLDDRPVTLQLPVALGRIAGVPVVTPPRALVGSYLHFGSPDAIAAWLNGRRPGDAAFVISNDMLLYGGLVASRVPGVTYADAYFRGREYATLRRRNGPAWVGAFGTVMRLAPTGIPAIEDAADFFAAYPTWTYLQQYANLHDPPAPDEVAEAERLRAEMGDATLQAYLQARARNVAADERLVGSVQAGFVDRGVLGQDDAGPVGLHVREIRRLEQAVADASLGARFSIEPGADELAMALVASALARSAGWSPRIGVRYSAPSGGAYQDPLEFAPVDTTIGDLIRLCGGVRDDATPDLTLFVRLPHQTPQLDDAFLDEIRGEESRGRPAALADLSFEWNYADEGAFAQRLLAGGAASGLDAYASWNTAANTVGTALAEAIAAGAGRRTHRYDPIAHRTFTFARFLDDVAFHVYVRPELNSWLDERGVRDHTYVPRAIFPALEARNSAELAPYAFAMLRSLDPSLHIAALRLTLPWRRTFETQIDASLAPNL